MRDRFSACSIVSAATNCSPSIRIAISTPRRITGSPYRAIRRVRAADNPRSLTVDVSRPVITRPQVAALTNRDRPVPAWEIQSPPAILSRIRASRVAASGMRRSASARHINATPSWLDRAYSCSSASTIDPRCLRRRDSISPRAVLAICARSGSGSVACSSRGRRQSGSGRRKAAVTARRSGVCSWIGGANAAKGSAFMDFWAVPRNPAAAYGGITPSGVVPRGGISHAVQITEDRPLSGRLGFEIPTRIPSSGLRGARPNSKPG